MSDKSEKGQQFAETAEFKAAVAAAVAAALPDAVKIAVSQVQTELLAAALPQKDTSEDGDLVQRLALAIAEISDQGTNRKRVAPEVLVARAEAHKRAVARIELARKRGEKPEYRLISKIYVNERLVEPFMPGPNKQVIPTEIFFDGMPSDAMRPINDVAKEIYVEYRASIGSTERTKNADTRPYYLTAGGMVIKGDPTAQRRQVAAPAEFADDFGVKAQHDPTAPFIAVLGTVHPKAKQNVDHNTAVI